MTKPCQHENKAFEQHNHKQCIEDALNTAHDICQTKSMRLTPLRKQVLTLVWQSHKPLGAYTIMDLLTANNQNQQRRVAPPTVYRALDFLQEVGLVHRIASLNAYIGCCSPSQSHHSHFLICRNCDSTVELTSPSISEAIQQSAQLSGFQTESEHVEVIGLCPNCQTPTLTNEHQPGPEPLS